MARESLSKPLSDQEYRQRRLTNGDVIVADKRERDSTISKYSEERQRTIAAIKGAVRSQASRQNTGSNRVDNLNVHDPTPNDLPAMRVRLTSDGLPILADQESYNFVDRFIKEQEARGTKEYLYCTLEVVD